MTSVKRKITGIGSKVTNHDQCLRLLDFEFELQNNVMEQLTNAFENITLTTDEMDLVPRRGYLVGIRAS